jgi:hypothetical protein
LLLEGEFGSKVSESTWVEVKEEEKIGDPALGGWADSLNALLVLVR